MYESKRVCRIPNNFFNDRKTKKKQALDHHMGDESCSAHRPHVLGTGTRDTLPGAEQAGGHDGARIDRKRSPLRTEKSFRHDQLWIATSKEEDTPHGTAKKKVSMAMSL